MQAAAYYIPCSHVKLTIAKGLTWLGVLLSDVSWFYHGGQCHSCCGERARV
jgi:hypothetical protein